ncbi:MAG TPA: DUF3224 domain-containing protein [Gemmatimonadaceae bacterium]|nr:DUF3224 domain-containing protein [Gemmatimonadaceae bacterium]
MCNRLCLALHRKQRTLVLQHSGTMTRGVQQAVITVVPDAGSGELARAGRADDHRDR